jgi:hypothetical protein
MWWFAIVIWLVAPAPATPKPSPIIFEFTASDGEFGVMMTLSADGSWQRVKHSGSDKGKLGAKLVRQFRAALQHAPFSTERHGCNQRAVQWATYRDEVGGRVASATRPCGDKVDAETENLPACLESLISNGSCP